MPALKGKLRLVSLTCIFPSSRNDEKCWYEAILDDFVEIDNLLEQLYSSMEPMQLDDISKEENFPFRVEVASCRIAGLYIRGLCPVFAAYQTFFDGFNFLNQSACNLTKTNQGQEVVRLTAVLIAQIDCIIRMLQTSLLGVAKGEWQHFVEWIDNGFQPRMKPPRSVNNANYWWWRLTKPPREKSFKLVSPLVKLCIFFGGWKNDSHFGRGVVGRESSFQFPLGDWESTSQSNFIYFFGWESAPKTSLASGRFGSRFPPTGRGIPSGHQDCTVLITGRDPFRPSRLYGPNDRKESLPVINGLDDRKGSLPVTNGLDDRKGFLPVIEIRIVSMTGRSPFR
ncbi:hypothetical protein PGT21_028453 [Puccinia graminis f. sp. tritici]|uniref:Uncharacterized protein n=1 Tax=Puccinia graminis f. sp. tritici TaxID=56615 RepID=A0A5B0PEK7_PUCGR|nr:hypothetical protein PGT21_028453 [Puccinia graminis f. sp. tritici]KAA1128128.1 hypothetical protein PGTUg99_013711 [Puccinia graminis f. sp. tritici]